MEVGSLSGEMGCFNASDLPLSFEVTKALSSSTLALVSL